jgi:hypothetical protein
MSTTIASMLYIYKGYKGTQTHTHRSVVQDCPDLIDLSLNGEGIGSLVGWACLACLETCCGPSLQLMLLGLSAAHHIVESDLNSGAMRSHAEPCGAMRSHAEPCGAMRSHAEPWLPAVLQDALITMSSDIYCFRNGVEGSHMTSDESSKIFGES